ncbi:MAG: beta-hydroxyacyl-ACP dehydratase, partial [Phycisphaerales bacterium]
MSDQLVESKFLVDLAGVDLDTRLYGREHIEGYNPHRGEMSLLDHIVWESDDHSSGVALKIVRDDEFWVKGHYPGKPMFPGVL